MTKKIYLETLKSVLGRSVFHYSPDKKKIIEEIPVLILDENFNESASDEFDNNLSTELKLNLSHEEIDRIIN